MADLNITLEVSVKRLTNPKGLGKKGARLLLLSPYSGAPFTDSFMKDQNQSRRADVPFVQCLVVLFLLHHHWKFPPCVSVNYSKIKADMCGSFQVEEGDPS